MTKKFSWKVFISFTLTFTFFIILFTGIILYLKPSGRIANWINWTLLGLDKHQWQTLHTIFSFNFAVFSLLHLFWINWKGFWSYIKNKKYRGFNKLKEFSISIIVVLVITFGSLYLIPPFRYVIDYGEYLSNSWDTEDNNPFVPHAEDLNLDELSNQLDNINLKQIINTLKSHKIIFDNVQQTLAEIAIKNNTTPNKIYKIIIEQPVSKTTRGMRGSGMGRKTLTELCKELDLNIDDVIRNLERAGYFGEANETLKDIAMKNDVSPMDIFNTINNAK